MPKEIKYAENIIVGVEYKEDWHWLISWANVWVLDYQEYQNLVADVFGVKPPLPQARTGIPIVNADTAAEFLDRLSDERVTTEYLQNVIKNRLPLSQLSSASPQALRKLRNEATELFPSLVVSFDQQVLYSGYPEMFRFENYAPEGWKGASTNLLPKIPFEFRYWWIDGISYFKYFGIID